MSIVDYGRVSPAIDTGYFPACRSSYYWSSSTRVNNSYYAWMVCFYYGYVSYNIKPYAYYVRCVRGGP